MTGVLSILTALLVLASNDVATARQATSTATSSTLPAGPTSAGEAVPTEVANPTGPPALWLIRQDPWIGPRGTFHLEVGATTPDGSYRLDARLLGEVSSIEDITAAGDLVTATTPFGWLRHEAVPAGTSVHQIGIPVVPEADGTFGDPYVLDPGVFPVEVRLIDRDGDIAASLVTHLVHLPPSLVTGSVRVGVIADLRLDPMRADDGRARLGSGTATGLEKRVDALDQLDAPVSLRIHPETVDTLLDTRTGDGGPPLSRLLQLAGIAGSGEGEILGATFVGFDEAAWLADRRVDILGQQLDAGRNALARAGLRSDAATLALGGPLGAELATKLGEFGFSRFVLDTAPQARQGALVGPGPLPLAGRPDLLVLPGPTAAVTPSGASGEGDGPLGPLEAHRAVALLLLGPIKGDRHPAQLRLGPEVDLDGPFAERILGILAGGGPLRGVTVDDLFDEPGEATATYVPDDASAPVGRTLPLSDELTELRLRVDGLRRMLDDDVLADELNRRLLLVPAEALDPAFAGALLDRIDSTIVGFTDAVVMPPSQVFTTTAHETTIPLVLRNESDRELQVSLWFSSTELEFPGANPVTVSLDPGPNDFEIPIRTRRSGEFEFSVVVTSPDRAITIGDLSVTVQSRAISGVGLFLSGGALTFLLVWWFRNFRRARQRRGTETATIPPGTSPDRQSDERGGADGRGGLHRSAGSTAGARLTPPDRTEIST